MKAIDTGGPASEETLLDRNARAAMQAMVGAYKQSRVYEPDDLQHGQTRVALTHFDREMAIDNGAGSDETAQDAYIIAAAMIAEKRRAEGKETKRMICVDALPIRHLDVTPRTRNALYRYDTIGDVAKCSESDLLRNRGFGATALCETRLALADYGMCLQGDEAWLKQQSDNGGAA